MLEASKQTPERIYVRFKAATETPSLEHGLLAAPALRRPRPGTIMAQNQLNWQKMREMCPASLASIPLGTWCYSSTFLLGAYMTSCPTEHPANKAEKNPTHTRQLQVLVQHGLEPSLFEPPVIPLKQ